MVNAKTLTLVLMVAALSACDGPEAVEPAQLALPRMEPIAIQQMKVYPETSEGIFVSLADFEESGPHSPGHQQVEAFSVQPASKSGSRKFVVNVTRTGAGAMAVRLPAGGKLVYQIPGYRDFSGYTLLSMALHSEKLRDDLRVTVSTESASWTSHPTLVEQGWNNILIDIKRLESWPGFDIRAVKAIEISFDKAAKPIAFNIDDIMLVDNSRNYRSLPLGFVLRKEGLDYRLTLPHRSDPIELVQCSDGLWRMGTDQATLQLGVPGEKLPVDGEYLRRMGRRKVGRVEVLEANPMRIRLANTWYFPTNPGEWVSLAVRQVRWEYTWYADGRWITRVHLNNSGGETIGKLRIWTELTAAWSTGVVARDMVIHDFAGPIGQWSFLQSWDEIKAPTLQINYLATGKLACSLADGGRFAPGDADCDRFDESQGCYYLQALNGNCRFKIIPSGEGLLSPIFRVGGNWSGRLGVNSQGLAIRDIQRLEDGSIIFAIPGWLTQPTEVEVTGEIR